MPLLLLHGAIGSSEQLKPLQAELIKAGFDARLFDFCGHGGREIPETPFSISLFADEVISWMDDHRIGETDIFGYSMGGYVGLYIAKHYPDRVGKVMTVATKFAWNNETSEREVKMLNPEKIEEKVPKFAEQLKQRHAPQDWREVLRRTGSMMLAMGEKLPLEPDDFRQIPHDVLVSVGDKDTMVSQDETTQVHLYVPNAQCKIFPDTPHPIEQMNVQLVVSTAVNFFNS
jgi:pimeloyl-ACP methyl ester carboxylesterase